MSISQGMSTGCFFPLALVICTFDDLVGGLHEVLGDFFDVNVNVSHCCAFYWCVICFFFLPFSRANITTNKYRQRCAHIQRHNDGKNRRNICAATTCFPFIYVYTYWMPFPFSIRIVNVLSVVAKFLLSLSL